MDELQIVFRRVDACILSYHLEEACLMLNIQNISYITNNSG